MAVKKINSLNEHQNPATNENEFDIENYLNENWEKIIDVVDNNADELTELNDKSDTNIQSLQEEISELEEDVKANSIIVTTEEATSLQINDANGARAKLSVKGNYRQETRSGKNVLLIADQTISNSGVTLKVEDGKYYLTGENTGSTTVLELTTNVTLKPGTYTMSTNSNSAYPYLQLRDSNNNVIGQDMVYEDNGVKTFTLEEEKTITKVRLYFGSSKSANELALQIESGSTKTAFEAAGKMPSRESPSEVETVGGNINILDNVAKTRTINGITFTVNKDGSVTAKGTASPQAILYLTSENNLATYKDIEKGKYTLNGCDDGNVNTYFIQVALENANPSNGAKYFSNYSIPTTFEVQEDNNRYYCMIVIKSGVTIDKTFYPSLIKGYKTVGYSRPGQAGISVKSYNKNLSNVDFNNKTSISEGIQDIVCSKNTLSFTLKANSSEYATIQYDNIFLNDMTKKFKNKQLIASCEIEGGDKTSIRLSKNNLGASSYIIGNIENGKPLQFTVTEDINSIAMFAYGSQGVQATSDIKCKFSNFMIREVDTTEEYVEHKEEVKTLDIQQEMLSGDYFDLERKKEVHSWNIQELTGNESWVTEGELEKVIRMATSTGKTSNNYTGKCTHFDFIGNYNLDEEHVYVTNPGRMYIFIDKTVASTPAEFKTFLIEQATAGTPVKVYWKSDTTTELDLTETQIEQSEQLNKLRTYKEQTNIVTVEDLALMQLEYSVDIQKYIDNKLANINQQILNLAGGN